MKAILIAILLFWGTAVEAQAPDEEQYWQGTGWGVYRISTTCILHTATRDGNWLFFMLHETDYTIVFGNNEVKSLQPGTTVPLTVVFYEDDKVSRTINGVNFGVEEGDKGRLFTSDKFGLDFGDMLAQSQKIGFFWKNKTGDFVLIGGIGLRGSAIGVQKLEECAFKQSGLNPNDPFLQ